MQDFNDLHFFAAVVTHNSFSGAARALGVPKSRLSRRVAILEEQLGVRLLERSTRQIALTQIGQQVFEHARAAVMEAEAVKEVALRMQTEPQGLVRMSIPLGMQALIAGSLPAFLAAHPLLRVQCIVTNRRVELIEEGIDVALRVRDRLDTDPMLQIRRLGTSLRILVASPSFLARHEGLESPADLAGVALLDQHEQARPGLWELTSTQGVTESVAVEPRFSTGSFELLLAAVREGLGVALIPAMSCQAELAAGTLVRVLPDWSGGDGIIHLVFTSRRGMLPGVRAVIEFAVNALSGSR